MTESSKEKKSNIILKVIQKDRKRPWQGQGHMEYLVYMWLQLTVWILSKLFIHPNASVSPDSH